MSIRILQSFALSAVLLLAGCVYDGPYNTHARVGVHGYYSNRYDDFLFYPDVRVYFNLSSRDYYYRPKDRWYRVHRLPQHIYLHPSHSYRIKAHRDHPYRNFNQHYDRYRQDRHDRRHDHRSDRRRHDSRIYNIRGQDRDTRHIRTYDRSRDRHRDGRDWRERR